MNSNAPVARTRRPHPRQSRARAAGLGAGILVMLTTGALQAQSSDLEEYRDMLADGNPAELLEMQGEELWKTARGPKKATLEQCDLGLGPGVIEGAYARLPRFFEDTGKVMDFESRLVHCMVSLQGFPEADVVKKPFSSSGQGSDIELLAAYVVEQSRGKPVAISQAHPQEKAAFERGRALFFYEAGPYDFSCATCHSKDGQRIRLQELPNLTKPEQAAAAFTSWPAYRVSQGALRTMQWRVNDCFRQQRFPEPIYGAQASIDLLTFLGVSAQGAPMAAPGIKR